MYEICNIKGPKNDRYLYLARVPTVAFGWKNGYYSFLRTLWFPNLSCISYKVQYLYCIHQVVQIVYFEHY